MKYKIYIDFDGVIWDSWPYLYKTLQENNALLYEKVLSKTTSHEDDKKITKIFNSMNWDELIKNTHPINDGINILRELVNSNLYEICVLTHCGGDQEIESKKKLLMSAIPGINVITVLKPTLKSEAVDARGALLIDDYVGNLIDWKNAGGIAVKFSTKKVVSGDFHHISSLDQITDIISALEYNNKTSEELALVAA